MQRLINEPIDFKSIDYLEKVYPIIDAIKKKEINREKYRSNPFHRIFIFVLRIDDILMPILDTNVLQ